MKQFHIALTDSERKELKKISYELDISMAEVMRRGFELLKKQLEDLNKDKNYGL